MICSAWFDLHYDDVVVDHPTAMRLYARLIRVDGIFLQPQEVPTWWYADNMGVKRKSIHNALNLLIERGYAVEHARSPKKVRMITLNMERPASAPEVNRRAPKGPMSSGS